MDIYLVSFTTAPEDIGYTDLELRRDRLDDSIKNLGFKKHLKWDRTKLKKTNFYKENKEILDSRKGAGFWLWKPYIILDTLERVNDGDIVIYADNSTYFIAAPKEEIKQCVDNNGFFLIHAYGHLCAQYTKRDTFHFMELDSAFYHNSPISLGSPQIYAKNINTVAFIKEWLHFCLNRNILTDLDNICGKKNFDNYISHRHDMSILSLLVAKHNIKTFIPIHDILNKDNIELLGQKKVLDLKKEHPRSDITYIYAQVIIFDRENHGKNLRLKLKRLLNLKKLFYILYRKISVLLVKQ